LTAYSKEAKAKILENHVNDSNLKDEYKKLLSKGDLKTFIIEHKSFSPRFIEFVTSNEIMSGMSGIADFKAFVRKSLGAPIEIWKHAYLEQINPIEQILLNTLYSFNGIAEIKELEKAFDCRMQFEVDNNNRTYEPLLFQRTLKRLIDGFVINKDSRIQFLNFSVFDFLDDYLFKDLKEIERIIQCACCLSQFITPIFKKATSVGISFNAIRKKDILDNYQIYFRDATYPEEIELIQMAIFISDNIKTSNSDLILGEILERIEDWSILIEDYEVNEYFIQLMSNISDNVYLNNIVERNIDEIILDLVSGEYDAESLVKKLESLSAQYSVNFSLISPYLIIQHIEDVFNEHIEQEIDWLKETMLDEGAERDKIKEIEALIERIEDLGLEIDPNMDLFKDVDWWEVASTNEFRRLMEKDD
jgi:hypothetical protein